MNTRTGTLLFDNTIAALWASLLLLLCAGCSSLVSTPANEEFDEISSFQNNLYLVPIKHLEGGYMVYDLDLIESLMSNRDSFYHPDVYITDRSSLVGMLSLRLMGQIRDRIGFRGGFGISLDRHCDCMDIDCDGMRYGNVYLNIDENLLVAGFVYHDISKYPDAESAEAFLLSSAFLNLPDDYLECVK